MSWIVAQTQPRRQSLAQEHVERQGAEIYMPRYAARGPRGQTIQFLFGTYAFVRMMEAWGFLLGTIGMSRVLMTGERPACVGDDVIERLRAREGRDGFVVLPVTPSFLVGQRVRLERGCFAGQAGIYEGSDSLERERVLLSILGRQVPISVGAGCLVAA